MQFSKGGVQFYEILSIKTSTKSEKSSCEVNVYFRYDLWNDFIFGLVFSFHKFGPSINIWE